MLLSADQLKALGQGEPVPITIDNHEFVVVKKDVFDKLRLDSESTNVEGYVAVLSAIDQDDENIDQYLDYLDESR